MCVTVGSKNLSPVLRQDIGKCSVYEPGQVYLDLTRFSLFILLNISIPVYSIFLILSGLQIEQSGNFTKIKRRRGESDKTSPPSATESRDISTPRPDKCNNLSTSSQLITRIIFSMTVDVHPQIKSENHCYRMEDNMTTAT